MMTRRDRRRRLACWLGSLIALTIGLLYIRSAFHPGIAVYTPLGYVGVADGLLVAQHWPLPPPGRPRMPFSVGAFGFKEPRMRWWFEWVGTPAAGRVQIPLWALLLPATLGVVILRRRGRVRPGACRLCGYDLTGNVTGRCPECGVSACDGAESQCATPQP